ncbi:hypothetical protein MPH_10250 [Macrophomina phaseolina MS6]|uniref:Uncharacterized protein n=1 Tax=Macrophomina phaseolina (strain MS6) TaxID=1126212 RepID=K2S6T8_MACPH|nr:hypothetical protein MPH_10250 [Macrophomina phaseolina MS6]
MHERNSGQEEKGGCSSLFIGRRIWVVRVESLRLAPINHPVGADLAIDEPAPLLDLRFVASSAGYCISDPSNRYAWLLAAAAAHAFFYGQPGGVCRFRCCPWQEKYARATATVWAERKKKARPAYAAAKFSSLAGRAMARNESVTGIGRVGGAGDAHDVAKASVRVRDLGCSASGHSSCGDASLLLCPIMTASLESAPRPGRRGTERSNGEEAGHRSGESDLDEKLMGEE